MTKTLRRLMSSPNSLKIDSSSSGAKILGVPIYTLGVDKLRIHVNDYESTPEINKALSFTGYTGKSMKKASDNLMMKNIIRHLGYTDVGDKPSKRKRFLRKNLPKLVEEIQSKTFEEITDNSDDLQGDGVKIIITSNIIDICTTIEVLLGLKPSGHTDTPTEASNLIDELNKRGKSQNKQQCRNVLNKFYT